MILFQIIQKPQKRGAEIFAAQLSEHLEKLGHTVILISLFEGFSELPFSGKKIQLNRPISKRWYDYEAWQQIARLVKEFKPDIIQCNAGDTLKFLILSKLFFEMFWRQIEDKTRTNKQTIQICVHQYFVRSDFAYFSPVVYQMYSFQHTLTNNQSNVRS